VDSTSLKTGAQRHRDAIVTNDNEWGLLENGPLNQRLANENNLKGGEIAPADRSQLDDITPLSHGMTDTEEVCGSSPHGFAIPVRVSDYIRLYF
jgi:hypothetical protein